jgi:NAD-dependent dihydropyrimidine dehydrogenase PreA subunit
MIQKNNITIFKYCYLVSNKPKPKGEDCMTEATFHGIPRSNIAWGPTINYEKCQNCGKCVDYCKLNVYEFEEKEGTKRSVVRNPNNCVVLCTGCDEICPAGAITHPSKMETREKIRDLRKTHILRPKKG